MKLAAALGCLLAVSVQPAVACVCLDRTGVRKAKRDADAVFVAEVTEVRPIACDAATERCGSAAYADLNVLRSWKGVAREHPRMTVFLPDPEACGYALRPGRVYLVYAGFSPPRNWASSFGSPTHAELMSVSLCSRTATLEDAGHDLRKLGRPVWTRGTWPGMPE